MSEMRTDEPFYRNGNATWRVVGHVTRDGVDYVIAQRDVVPAGCSPRAVWPADVWAKTAWEVVA